MKKSIPVSIRLPLDMIFKLESLTSGNEKKFATISEAIRSHIEVGFMVASMKSKIKDPEFLNSIEEIKKKESIFEWVATLRDNELSAIQTACQMERDGRYNQREIR